MNRDKVKAMAADPREFRRHILIDTPTSGPKPFAEVADDWQVRDLEAIDNSLRMAVGLPLDPELPLYKRAWIERPRGHSKSSDIAIAASWCIFASRRQFSGQIAASDRDQAGLVRDSVLRLVRINPWLGKFVEAQAHRVLNPTTGSCIDVVSCDVGSSFGRRDSLIIADEICHWRDGGRDLWTSILSTAAKNSSACILAITNAGFVGSWQWESRQAVWDSPLWYCSRLNGQKASWIDADLLAEQEKLLPAQAYRRLWLNCWVDAIGDVIEEGDLKAAIYNDPPMLRIPEFGGWTTLLGVDIGLVRDRSAIVVVGVRSGNQKVKVLHVRHWKPRPGMQVQLEDVENEIIDCHRRFRVSRLRFDPYQFAGSAQKLQRRGIFCEPVHFSSAKACDEMALAIVQLFRERRIEIPDDKLLLADLGSLVIEEKRGSLRLVAATGSAGHSDSAFALACVAPIANYLATAKMSNSKETAPQKTYVTRDPLEVGVSLVRPGVPLAGGRRDRPRFRPPGYNLPRDGYR
jgi:phage terminase large subunit-like protein